MEIMGDVQTSEKTISSGWVEVSVEEEKGSLCILLIEQALQGLFNKMFEDKGKLKLEIVFWRIDKVGWPNLECQSDIDALTTDA